MTQNDIVTAIQKQRWEKFITRPYTPFFISLHIRIYSQPLPELPGIQFRNFVYVSHRGIVDIYRKSEEIERVKQWAFRSAKKNPKKVRALITSSYRAAAGIRRDTRTARQAPKTFSNFARSVERYKRYFIKLTVFPYFLGLALETYGDVRTKEAQHILRRLKKLREVDHYSAFEKAAIHPYLRTLSRHVGAPNDLVAQLTFEEMRGIAEGRLQFDRKEMHQRRLAYAYCFLRGKEYIMTEQRFVKKVHALLAPRFQSSTTLSGVVAERGMVRGRVRMIQKIQDLPRFKKGEILVAMSTSPSFLSAIRKAAAIVTDEGGMISHASILARELKIPCIIGTKIATKILKDGDRVEVDATKGIVRKL